jgi:hypothetical protein
MSLSFLLTSLIVIASPGTGGRDEFTSMRRKRLTSPRARRGYRR